MANVFKKQTEINEHPNRVNHDLSHSVLGSYAIGKLYPVFCKPVVPGDSFLVDSAAAFNFMPLNYPTPSRMRVSFTWFYQRTKNVWKNFPNFLEGLESHTHPYIEQPASFYKTGSLADHLGVPSTLATNGVVDVAFATPSHNHVNSNSVSQGSEREGEIQSLDFAVARGSVPLELCAAVPNVTWDLCRSIALTTSYGFLGDIPFSTYPKLDSNNRIEVKLIMRGLDLLNTSLLSGASWHQNFSIVYFLGTSRDSATNVTVDGGNYWIVANSGTVSQLRDNSYLVTLKFDISGFGTDTDPFLNTELGDNVYMGIIVPKSVKANYVVENASVAVDTNIIRDISNGVSSPYYNSSNQTDTIRINALPFRVYESIYNAFFRNWNGNQPFMIGGVPQYNKYNTTTDDGADTTDYHLFFRNWELDPYTSGMPSPQQGNAPVVGVNTLGDITLRDENGLVSTFSATSSGNDVEVMSTSPAASVDNARVALSILNSGFTINDFRSVNALQRFLETSLRKGYKYIDFIKGHFGQSPKHAEMDMPEFLGGYNLSVEVGKVTSLAETTEGSLGDYKGEAAAFGANKHKLKHYFDDYGYLMCIMCIVPEPSYSQLLPKHFMQRNRLDYYFPEFAQLGMQPITYEEVCPIQSHNEYASGQTTHKITDTFCYQRPNHDMVFYPNTIHGLFRTDLNDYIINRMFVSRPELGNSFLTIKPEETNSIFQYEKGEDVMVGQVVFKISAKRPVPYVVIPSLGR